MAGDEELLGTAFVQILAKGDKEVAALLQKQEQAIAKLNQNEQARTVMGRQALAIQERNLSLSTRYAAAVGVGTTAVGRHLQVLREVSRAQAGITRGGAVGIGGSLARSLQGIRETQTAMERLRDTMDRPTTRRQIVDVQQQPQRPAGQVPVGTIAAATLAHAAVVRSGIKDAGATRHTRDIEAAQQVMRGKPPQGPGGIVAQMAGDAQGPGRRISPLMDREFHRMMTHAQRRQALMDKDVREGMGVERGALEKSAGKLQGGTGRIPEGLKHLPGNEGETTKAAREDFRLNRELELLNKRRAIVRDTVAFRQISSQGDQGQQLFDEGQIARMEAGQAKALRAQAEAARRTELMGMPHGQQAMGREMLAQTNARTAQLREGAVAAREQSRWASSPEGLKALREQIKMQKELTKAQGQARWRELVVEHGRLGATLHVTRQRAAAVGDAFREVGSGAGMVFAGLTAGLGGVLAAASPSAMSTLLGSFKMLSIAIGADLIPWSDKLSGRLQAASRWYNSLDDSTRVYIARTAVMAAATLGTVVALNRLAAVALFAKGTVMKLGSAMLWATASPWAKGIVGLTILVGTLAAAWKLVGSTIGDVDQAQRGLGAGVPQGAGQKHKDRVLSREELQFLPPDVQSSLLGAKDDQRKREQILQDFANKQEEELKKRRAAQAQDLIPARRLELSFMEHMRTFQMSVNRAAEEAGLGGQKDPRKFPDFMRLIGDIAQTLSKPTGRGEKREIQGPGGKVDEFKFAQMFLRVRESEKVAERTFQLHLERLKGAGVAVPADLTGKDIFQSMLRNTMPQGIQQKHGDAIKQMEERLKMANEIMRKLAIEPGDQTLRNLEMPFQNRYTTFAGVRESLQIAALNPKDLSNKNLEEQTKNTVARLDGTNALLTRLVDFFERNHKLFPPMVSPRAGN